MFSRTQRGITLLELVVAIAIIAILVAVLMPAIMAVRSAARKSQCQNRLRNISIAIQSYVATYHVIPPSGVRGYSIHARLLPYLERENLCRQIKFNLHISDHYDSEEGRMNIDIFKCPAEGNDETWGCTNFGVNVGNGHVAGYNGFFAPYYSRHRKFLRHADVTDGLSNTIAMAELSQNLSGLVRRAKPKMLDPKHFEDFVSNCRQAPVHPNLARYTGNPWLLGGRSYTAYHHVLPPNNNSCSNSGHIKFGIYTASSWHPDGLYVLYGDGRTSWVADYIEMRTWRHLGSRNGDEIVSR